MESAERGFGEQMGNLSDHNHSVCPMASGVYRLNCFPGRGRFADHNGPVGAHRVVLRNCIGCCSYENEKLLLYHTIAWCNESVWQVIKNGYITEFLTCDLPGLWQERADAENTPGLEKTSPRNFPLTDCGTR